MPAATLRERYEQLREGIVTGTALSSRRWGGNLLLMRGLAAWIHAWPREERVTTIERCRTSAPVTDIQLPERLQQQMASVLVEMILRQSVVPV